MAFIIVEDRDPPHKLFYREHGAGFPLLFLHGGWGYGIYPFGPQIEALSSLFRILIPDRVGYGQSGRVSMLPPGFHETAADQMRRFLNSVGIDRCMLWGHSDGAVTAGLMCLNEPERFPAVIFEAIHYDRCKPKSRGFFETMATNPRKFGASVEMVLSREHGESYWEELLTMEGRAWLHILDHCMDPAQDLFRGRIGDIRVPSLLIHGSLDPRTEPDELERLRIAMPRLEIHLLKGAGHSPHSEMDFLAETTRIASGFLNRYRPD
jgi:pimeloyl-ACP methyl ester carboxylesterase